MRHMNCEQSKVKQGKYVHRQITWRTRRTLYVLHDDTYANWFGGFCVCQLRSLYMSILGKQHFIDQLILCPVQQWVSGTGDDEIL